MEKSRVLRWKNRLINLAVTLVTCLVLFGIYLLVFNSYKKDLRGYKAFSQFTTAQTGIAPLTPYDAVQLGRVHTPNDHPKSSYLNYAKKKQAGKFRIGIFGCSFVRGVGAAHGYDFPSLLQEKYLEIGKNEVEVINFGVPMYGMNRSFYLWNSIGKAYQLDLVIFNVRGFHPLRDRTFIFNDDTYGSIHGRYILEDGKLRYIPVLGDNRAATSANYYSPFPAWQYWKYEAKTPVAFRALMPKGKALKQNPFYYHSDLEAEWKTLYAAIFDSVAKVSPRLILAYSPKTNIAAFTEFLTSKNIDHYPLNTMLMDPAIYVATDKHYSGLGNQVIAEGLFDYLQDSVDSQLPVFSFEKGSRNSREYHADWGNLQEVQRLFLGIGGEELAILFNDKNAWKDRRIIKKNPAINFEKLGIKALITIFQKKYCHLLPLDSSFVSGTPKPLRARFWVGEQEKVIELAKLAPSTSFWGIADTFANSYQIDNLTITFETRKKDLRMRVFGLQKISNLRIELGETTILHGERIKEEGKGQSFTLIPAFADWILIRADLDQQIDIHELPQKGIVDLMIEYKTGEIKSLPFVEYKVENVKVAQ